MLLAIVRLGVRGHSRRDWLIALAFGVCLVSMNWAIYQAFARIPLGIAVTIEFLGPLAVAVLGSKRLSDLVWVGLAGLGVALLGLSRAQLNLAGVAFALLAALLWAGYILLSRQTGRRWPGISGLAVASLVGAVIIGPAAIVQAGDQLRDPRILLLGLAIGLLSSVDPVQLRTHRPAPDAGSGLRHLDEPRTRGGRAGRDDPAGRIPQPGAVAGDGLRGGREHRSGPQRRADAAAGTRLTWIGSSSARTSC